MANYTIGEMILQTRESLGYSQEELCYGICSTSSLSRIENGTQVPGRRVFDALMQRMGISVSIYSSFVSRREMEIYRLIQVLAWKMENHDWEETDRLIARLEEMTKGTGGLERQYLLFAKACRKKREGAEPEEVLLALLAAIHLTMPDYTEQTSIKNRLLTFDEITVLNSIAVLYDEMGRHEESLRLLYELKRYLEEHVMDESEKAKKYPMILNNIAWRIGDGLGNHWEAYRISSIGIRYCIRHNKLAALPYLILNKAAAAYEMGHKKESGLLYHQALTLLQICEKEAEEKQVLDEIADRFPPEHYVPSIKSHGI